MNLKTFAAPAIALALMLPMAAEARQVRGTNYLKEQNTRVAEPVEDITDHQLAAIQALAGGPEGYAEMMQWAAARFPKAKVKAFDAVVSSGDVLKIFKAVNALVPVFKADSAADFALSQKQLVAKWSF